MVLCPVGGTGRRLSFPVAPPSRPGPRNSSHTFLCHCALPQNMIPSRHTFLGEASPFGAFALRVAILWNPFWGLIADRMPL